MTIEQAHNYIKVEIDKTSSLELPALVPEEINYWLDDSILKFAKQRYTGNNVKGESFEQSQKRIEDLRLLIKEIIILPSAITSVYTNGITFDLPADYLLSLREGADIHGADLVHKKVRVVPTTHDKVNFKLEDPFAEHISLYGFPKPLRLFVDKQIVLIGDGTYTINNVNLSYIKIPAKVNTISAGNQYLDLSDSAMHEVIKLCANSILENIENPRYQSHSAEVALIE